MTDFELQRRNMVESQVRPSDVTDRRVISAMLEIPREQFVPEAMRTLAYGDGAVSIVAPADRSGRALMAPRTLAKLVDLARIERKDIVLDVGAGTGYSSALLARLAETVVGLEADAGLAGAATRNLNALSVDNAAIVQGPLTEGWRDVAPYAAIILQGSVDAVPQTLLAQLAEGGRLVAIVNEGPVGRARIWRRRGDAYDVREAFDASAPLLPGFAAAPAFSL